MAMIAVLTTAADAQSRLRIEVATAPPDPDHVIIGAPASTTYVGRLTNTDKSSMLVQVIAISGRHQGNGLRDACYLERWDSTSHQWLYVAPSVIGIEPTPVYSLTLRGGEAAEVCGPATFELGQCSACYRFILQVQTKGSNSPSFLFKTFRVGLPAENMRSGCHD